MSRLRCYERRWTGSMAEDGSELRRLEEQLHRLLSAGGEPGRGDSQRFCSDFCTLVEQHVSRWQLPLPQLRILKVALSSFATATGNFPPGCHHVTHTLGSLALSVFELLLFLEPEDFRTELLLQLSAAFQDCQRMLSGPQSLFLVQVERVLRSGGPWSSPVLRAVLSESTLPQSQVDGCLASEPPVFLELRILYLLSRQRVTEAMALARCCARHPATGRHLFFLQVYLGWLCRTGQQQALLREVSLLGGDLAVRVVCGLEAEEDDGLLLGLCTACLTQQLLRGDLHCLRELVLVWLKLQTRLNVPPDALLAESRRLLLSAANVNAIFPFMRAVLQEVGGSGASVFCVELCLRALQASPSRSLSTQALVYKTLALLLRRDLEVCRACALLVFFLERSAAAFATVHRLYSLPDQQYQADRCPVGNRLRFDTLQVLKKDLFFDPEFWNLVALRTSCLKLMSEKAVSAALREIADDKSAAKDVALRRRTAGSKRSRRCHAAANEPAPKRRKAQPAPRRQDAARRSFWQLDRLQRDCNGAHRRNTRLSENQKRRIRTPRWLLEDSGTLDQIAISKNRRRAQSVKTKENGVRNHKVPPPVPQLVLELSLPDNEVPGTFPDDARPRGLPQVLLYRQTVKLPETPASRAAHGKEVVLRARDTAMFVQQLHCYARKRHGKVGAVAHGSASTITRSSKQASPTKDSPRESAEAMADKDGEFLRAAPRRRRELSEKVLTADDCAVEMKVTIASPSPILEKVREDEAANPPLAEFDGTSSPRALAAAAPVTEPTLNPGDKSPPAADGEADPAAEESDDEPETEESRLEFRCTFCDKAFRGRRVVEHAMFHYRRDQCMFCGAAFRDDLLAMMHLSDHIERLKRPQEPDALRARGGGRRWRRWRRTHTKDKATLPRQHHLFGEQATLPRQQPQITEQATLPRQQPQIKDQVEIRQQPQIKDQVEVRQQPQIKDQVEVRQQPQIKDQVEVQQQPQIKEQVERRRPQDKSQVKRQRPQIEDQVEGQAQVKDYGEAQEPQDKDQIEGQPKIKNQVEGQPKIKDQVEGQPQAKDQVEGQPKIEDQVEGQPKIEDQVEGQPKIEVQVQGQPKIEDQVEGQPKIKDHVEGQPQIEDQVQGQPKIEDHREGQARVKDPKIKERLAAPTVTGRKHSRGVPAVLDLGRSLRSGNKPLAPNGGGTDASKVPISRESNVDGKKPKSHGEPASCPAPGCSWSPEPSASRAAPLYHALEAHAGSTEALAAVFHAAAGVCPACLRVLRNLEHFRHHAERHRLAPRHPCPHRGCPARFKTGGEMRRHARTHRPLQAACCLPGCPRLFVCLWALNLHEKEHFPRHRRVAPPPHRHGNKEPHAPTRRGRPRKGNTVAASEATTTGRDPSGVAAMTLTEESVTKNQKLVNRLKRSARKRHVQKLATSGNSRQVGKELATSGNSTQVEKKLPTSRNSTQVEAKLATSDNSTQVDKKLATSRNSTQVEAKLATSDNSTQVDKKLATSWNSTQVDQKMATSGNFPNSAQENRANEEVATCSNLQQPFKKCRIEDDVASSNLWQPNQVDAELAPSSNTMQSVKNEHLEEKPAKLSNVDQSAKRRLAKEKLATCTLRQPVGKRQIAEQPATSGNFQKSAKRKRVEEKLTSSNSEGHTGRKSSPSSNLQKFAKRKRVKDKLILLSNLKQFVEKSHKEKPALSNPAQSGKKFNVDKKLAPSSASKTTKMKRGKDKLLSSNSESSAKRKRKEKTQLVAAPKLAAVLKRKLLAASVSGATENVSATLSESDVQPESETTAARDLAGPGNSQIAASSTIARQPLSEKPRKSQKTEAPPSEATAKRKLPNTAAVTSGKRKRKCETATTGKSRGLPKSETAKSPGNVTEGAVAERDVGDVGGRRLPSNGDSSVCLATLEKYRRKPYLRLPPTAYLAERFTAMPRRRRRGGLWGGAEPEPAPEPPAPAPEPPGPAPRRCPTCFSSFLSGEQLRQHLALDGCSAFFGFDD